MPQPRGEPETVRMLIGGPWREGRDTNEVIDPCRNDAAARAPRSTLADLDDARRAAAAAKKQAAALPGYQRAEFLHRGRKLLLERADDIGRTMAREPATQSRTRAEAVRSQETAFRWTLWPASRRSATRSSVRW